MRETYSLYDAKARLSAIIRRVREGHSVVITVHGTPVAEVRPVEQEPASLEQRLERLADRGVLVRPEPGAARPAPGERRPGALERFLADRDQ